MNKKALIKIELVPEAQQTTNTQIKTDISKTLTCDWLARIENIVIIENTSNQ